MTPNERRSAVALGGIFSTRLLGLFMILPTFSLYALHLPGATASNIGIALGIYGLTQALLQLPFGLLSDRFGRKRIITFGLMLFAIGSFVAALSDSIGGVILGRALQGSGAIGSTLIALMADLTREEQRSKAMAIMGMMIGFSFSFALVIGPIVSFYFSVQGIFVLTGLLALFGIIILHSHVPDPFSNRSDESLSPHLKQLPVLFKNRSLLKLNFGIFSQHAILTANFVILPLLLNSLMPQDHPSPLFYLLIIASSFAVAVPIIIYTHRKKKAHILLPVMIGVLALSQLLFIFFHSQLYPIAANLILFFIAFNVLEAELPAQISTIAPPAQKGAAMGIYSTCQFLGIFCGGAIGGILYGHLGSTPIFILGLGLAAIWFTLSLLQKRSVLKNEDAVQTEGL
ncbi:MAG: major facilitator superfamily 1 [Gammaproteobacteria bacterium]|nr:major facilitator superfamily 1 [Gammaproteobacteria bacterium]